MTTRLGKIASVHSMKYSPLLRQLSFQSRLERIASSANYFALSVPMKISLALGTRGPVPTLARVNDLGPFPVSLYPVGDGRHYLRVKAKIRNAAKIKGGDRVRVRFGARSFRDFYSSRLGQCPSKKGVAECFRAISIGKQNYLIRSIDEAMQTPDPR